MEGSGGGANSLYEELDKREARIRDLEEQNRRYQQTLKLVRDCREKWRGCEHDAETLSNRDCEAWEACKKAVRELNGEPEKEEHQS